MKARKFAVKALNKGGQYAFDRNIPTEHFVNFYEMHQVRCKGRNVEVIDKSFEKKVMHFASIPDRYELDESGQKITEKVIKEAKAEKKKAEKSRLKEPEPTPESVPEDPESSGTGEEVETLGNDEESEKAPEEQDYDDMSWDEVKKAARNRGITVSGVGVTKEALIAALKEVEG